MNNLISKYGEELILNGRNITNNSTAKELNCVRDYMVKPQMSLPKSITDWKREDEKTVVIKNGGYRNEYCNPETNLSKSFGKSVNSI